MMSLCRGRLSSICLVVGVCLSAIHPAEAQQKRGFRITLDASSTIKELAAQDDLWVVEVQFKPMRLISVEVTDPKTKKKTRQLVWYLIYKAINRPLDRRPDTSNTRPVNEVDPNPRTLFVPEFTLVTNDKDGTKIYPDVIIPEAQAAIQKRESRRPTDPVFKNSVEVVGPLPPVTAPGAKQQNVIYGVVMWKQVDSRTDYFTIFMSGFSNGYQTGKGPAGKPLLLRRTIVQQYWRPGDRFDQNEDEFRPRGAPRWIYRPDGVNTPSAKPPVPK